MHGSPHRGQGVWQWRSTLGIPGADLDSFLFAGAAEEHDHDFRERLYQHVFPPLNIRVYWVYSHECCQQHLPYAGCGGRRHDRQGGHAWAGSAQRGARLQVLGHRPAGQEAGLPAGHLARVHHGPRVWQDRGTLGSPQLQLCIQCIVSGAMVKPPPPQRTVSGAILQRPGSAFAGTSLPVTGCLELQSLSVLCNT